MAFYKNSFLLAKGETKALSFVVSDTYAVIISVSGRTGGTNSLYFASGYGLSGSRNSVYKIVGGLELTIGFNDELRGFTITNETTTDVNIAVFFMHGSTYTLS